MANKAILVGNVGAEPEIKQMQSGDSVANVSLATSESWKDKNGEKQTKTEWHRVVVFGKLADIIEKYVHKGDKLYIEGKIQTRKWQDKEGNDRWSTEIVIDFNGKMEMLGGKGDNSAPKPVEVTETEGVDETIPF